MASLARLGDDDEVLTMVTRMAETLPLAVSRAAVVILEGDG